MSIDLIGMGEDGIQGLSQGARQKLRDATLLIGSPRLLAMCTDLDAETICWPSPFGGAAELVGRHLHRGPVVLASGDPLCFGIGSQMVRAFGIEHVKIWPHISAFSLAASRLGWSLQNCECISLHGRPLAQLHNHLFPRARILCLTGGSDAPHQLWQLLQGTSYKDAKMTVLERLGSSDERVRVFSGDTPTGFAALHLVAIECHNPQNSHQPVARAVLNEGAIVHDGNVTKSALRSVALAHLQPFPGAIMWDIGVGNGSVLIDFARMARQSHCFGVDRVAQRIANAKLNADKFGLANVSLLCGEARATIADWPTPDAIFLGGGASDAALLALLMKRLAAHGTLVAHGVSLKAQSELSWRHRTHGGALSEIAVRNATLLGRHQALRPAWPVTQWVWRKGDTP